MSQEAYWEAIRASDVRGLRAHLEAQPGLVGSTYPGEAGELDPSSASGFTNTALHFAVVHDDLELARTLLEAGSDVNALGYTKERGLTPPLVLAAAEGSLEMLKLLLAHGADPNLPASAETALYAAVENDFTDKSALLIEHGARHDVFTAAIAGDIPKVIRFLEAYPDLLKARSLKRNRTPWDEAAIHEREALMAAIREWTERSRQEPASEPELSHWAGEELWDQAPAESLPATSPELPSAAAEEAWDDWISEDSAW